MGKQELDEKDYLKDQENNSESIPNDTQTELETKLAEAKALADDYLNNWQRLQAEFDNYRKRTLKEKEEIIRYASEDLISSLLPVLDNFERAIASAGVNKDFEGYAKGVDLIFRQLMTALGREGLKPIDVDGQTFDPNLHEAMMRVEMEGCPENTIVEELQKGYLLKDKVIRPTRVKVSS